MLSQTIQNHFLYTDVTADNIFTPEDFTDEHQMLAEMAERFVKQSIRPVLEKIENKEFNETTRLIKESGNLGLIAADIPEKDGGLGLGKVSGAIISEKMADSRSFSITFGGQTGIGALPIAYFGSDAQKKHYLPNILSGDKIAAYALTEPSSGTDALGARTTAILSADGHSYILNGEKQWISNSAFADIFIVYAKVDGKHFTGFIVERTFEGVSISQEEKKMGLHGSSTCSVILDNVAVPVDNVLGEIGKGHIIAFNVLNIGRQKISTSSLGTAKRSIELAVTYANQRKQFQTPISQFHLIQEKIADMGIKTFANESAVYRTAGKMEVGFKVASEDPNTDYGKLIAKYALECSINKVMSTEVLDFVVDEALQIHGGYGYMQEYEIETLYRDSRVNRIFEGTNEINRLIIAATVLKQTSDILEIETPKGPLVREKILLNELKNIHMTVKQAIQKQEKTNTNIEQEVAAVLANLVVSIYAIESVILRTEKAIKETSFDKQSLKYSYTSVYAVEEAQKALFSLISKSNYLQLPSLISLAPSILNERELDIVSEKRKIAQAIIKAQKFTS